MGPAKQVPFLRRHKLMVQTIAFVAMMIVPVFLYQAATVGSQGWMLALLAVQGGGMALAVAVS